MGVNIFLDDYRSPENVDWVKLPDVPYVVVRNYQEFVSYVERLEQAPAFVTFDHDLADAHYRNDFSNPNEKTGYDCAKALVDICVAKGWKLPEFKVHSLNVVGARNIQQFLDNARTHLDL